MAERYPRYYTDVTTTRKPRLLTAMYYETDSMKRYNHQYIGHSMNYPKNGSLDTFHVESKAMKINPFPPRYRTGDVGWRVKDTTYSQRLIYRNQLMNPNIYNGHKKRNWQPFTQSMIY